ncbi:MAG: hypothetical protein M3157_03290 [Actinomycetota bacterium]|nr:hypothetical protein [Actinomycetota bacterium]
MPNQHSVPDPERYAVEYIELPPEGAEASQAKLQDVLNEGAKQSRRLVGVATDPVGKGVIVVWDLEGFISG